MCPTYERCYPCLGGPTLLLLCLLEVESQVNPCCAHNEESLKFGLDHRYLEDETRYVLVKLKLTVDWPLQYPSGWCLKCSLRAVGGSHEVGCDKFFCHVKGSREDSRSGEARALALVLLAYVTSVCRRGCCFFISLDSWVIPSCA